MIEIKEKNIHPIQLGSTFINNADRVCISVQEVAMGILECAKKRIQTSIHYVERTAIKTFHVAFDLACKLADFIRRCIKNTLTSLSKIKIFSSPEMRYLSHERIISMFHLIHPDFTDYDDGVCGRYSSAILDYLLTGSTSYIECLKKLDHIIRCSKKNDFI